MLSRRRFLAGALAGLAGMAVAACSAAIRSAVPTATPSQEPTASVAPSPAVSPSDLGPTLREKIGGMLVIGFRGSTPAEADATLRQIASLALGGVVLFDRDQLTSGPRNVASPEQLAALVRSLKEASTVVPLTVAIDQEGGRVARLDETYGFPPPARSAAELGRLNDPAVTEAEARAMAEVLVAAGITLNLAPVVDLAVNPTNPIIAAVDRSYGADPPRQ